MFLNRARAVYHFLELGWLPKPGVGIDGGFGHFALPSYRGICRSVIRDLIEAGDKF